MEVALAGRCACNTVPLEVVVESLDTTYSTSLCELELSILPEARRVRVEESPGVSKGFKDELSSGNLCGKLGAFLPRIAYAQLEQRLDSESPVFGFPTARLAAKRILISNINIRLASHLHHQNTLVLRSASHVVICVVGKLEDMWRHWNLARRRVAVLRGIFVHNRV